MPIPFIDSALDRLMEASTSLFNKRELIAGLELLDKPDAHSADEGSGKRGFWARIRSLDVFPKFEPEYLRHTSSGGVGSIICFVLMGVLMAAELYNYLIPTTSQEFSIDTRIRDTMTLDFSISLGTPCGLTTVLIAEASGLVRMLNEKSGEIKQEDILFPIDMKRGKIKRISSGEAEEMDEAPEGYLQGCRVYTPKPFEMARTDGKLMILPVTDLMGFLGQMIMQNDRTINFSHIIHKLSFGREYPGQKSPLTGQSQPAMQYHEDFSYFLSILPTRYRGMWRSGWLDSNQYSLTGFLGQKDEERVEKPGLYFTVKVEPLSVSIKRQRTAFRTFLVRLIGILGGIYTAFGLINSMLVTAYDWILGKNGSRRRSSSVRSVSESTSDPSLTQISGGLGEGVHEQLLRQKDPNMAV